MYNYLINFRPVLLGAPFQLGALSARLVRIWVNTALSVTDRQTEGHSFSGYTSACIACYANALVKTLWHVTLYWLLGNTSVISSLLLFHCLCCYSSRQLMCWLATKMTSHASIFMNVLKYSKLYIH